MTTARPSFKANCATCGAEVIRHSRNSHDFKCWECRQKDKRENTKRWYRTGDNRQKKIGYYNAKRSYGPPDP